MFYNQPEIVSEFSRFVHWESGLGISGFRFCSQICDVLNIPRVYAREPDLVIFWLQGIVDRLISFWTSPEVMHWDPGLVIPTLGL